MSEDVSATDPAGAARRALLLGTGALGATAVLAACGTDSDTDNGIDTQAPTGGTDAGQPTGAATGGATGGADGGTKLGSAAKIPVGGGVIFAGQGVVVTQPEEGTFKGFSAVCTHKGCPLSAVEGGTINCNCHNSKFSIEDGSVTKGPATKGLEAKTVTKDGDSIILG